MQLQTPVHSTARFTWVPASKTFVAEMSDFNGAAPFTRLYDDSCDAGLTLRSAKTGREVVCFLAGEDRNGEGELQGLRFQPLKPADRALFNEVLLIND